MSDTSTEATATYRVGTVSAIDEKTCRVRVRLDDFDGLRTAWLPVLQAKTQRDKHYALPYIGEHVAVLLDARGEDGVVLGAIYSEADPPPVSSVDKHHVRFEDDTEFEYDRAAHQLTIKGGIETIVIEVGATVTVKAGTKLTLDVPDAEVTGNLLVGGALTYMQGMTGYGGGGGASAVLNGTVEVTGGDVIADAITLKTHKHNNVQPGSGTTGLPVT